MKKIFSILLLVGLMGTAMAQSDTARYRSLASEIQKKYAPDKRSIYFSLRMRGDSVQLESTSAEAIQQFELNRPKDESIKFNAVLLPVKSAENLQYGIANISVANNRSNAQHGAELMTQMLLGTPVEVLKKQGGFYLVRTPDQYLAWTDAAAIKLMNQAQFKAWQGLDKVVFTADYGHAFDQPNLKAKRVSDLVNGNILQLIATTKDFYKVGFPDGRIGFIPNAQISSYPAWVKRSNPTAAAILATAETLIGVPYLWGGTSIKGVDCSGFTKTAYFLNGIIIPRDASQQALVGKEIDVMENDSISLAKCLKNLQAGDLLFFSAAKRRGVKGGRVTHTAIYMGDGTFIQSAGMVKVSSLVPTAANYDGGQTPTLVGARRILTEIGKSEITRIDQHEWYGK